MIRRNQMSNLTEQFVEQFVIELLQYLGWNYVFGLDIAPDSENNRSKIANRKSFEDVILLDVLENKLRSINPQISEDAIKDVVKVVSTVPAQSPNLMANNEVFHRLLTEGIKVTYRKDGEEKGDIVKLIDFETPENNDFLAANQFTVVENKIKNKSEYLSYQGIDPT